MMLIMVDMHHHSQGKSYELPQEGLGETLENKIQLPKTSKY